MRKPKEMLRAHIYSIGKKGEMTKNIAVLA
jgi:hypothetical protein